jgi:hypothetical protein
MKLALASDLYVDCYPDDQRIDWRLVRRWTGVDVLVIGGNISASSERTKLEVLAAREAFDRVIFVEANHEHQTGLQGPEGVETLRRFAALNDGVHYLDGEAGVLVGHTLVCGVAGWQEHQAAILARRVREAAADQAVGEIVVVTHAAPHPDGLVFTGDEPADGISLRAALGGWHSGFRTGRELEAGRQHHAKAGLAAHHPLIGFGSAIERCGLDHWADAGEGAEGHGVLRVHRRPRRPALD